MTQFHTADNVFVDTDEGRFQLHVFTNDGEHLIVDIHADAVKFHDQVRRELGPWAAEAREARHAVKRGVTREEYLRDEYAHARMRGEFADDDDTGYALDDPKHPTYHDRMVD